MNKIPWANAYHETFNFDQSNHISSVSAFNKITCAEALNFFDSDGNKLYEYNPRN